MPSTGPRAKHWSFTLNNYTPEQERYLSELVSQNDDVVYIIFGKEVSSTGTPHLQGHVTFQSRKRMQQAIQLVGQCHFSVSRSVSHSIEYCKKDGDFLEFGECPKTTQGERNDLEEFKNSVKEGITDMRTLREMHSQVCASYATFVREYIRDHRAVYEVPSHPLRGWQESLNSVLNNEPDDREIIFVVDRAGKQGKSWFARYYQQNHVDNAQIIIPGKKADMAYVLLLDQRVLLFDCPRSKQGEFIQYDFLEECKNGYVFSSKYESIIKFFKTPHVVVLMNEDPQMDKLSEDRYNIIRLD